MKRTMGLETFCSESGTTLKAAKAKLGEIGLRNYLEKPDRPTGKPYIYFSIVSLAIPSVKHILELGAGLGESTNVLSKLFPAAKIYTIDLPKSDKKHKKWRYFKKQGTIRFEENLKEANIKFIENNTFFLPQMELPEFFELIFVDGGHWYPVVAWDIMFGYSRLAREGFMFMHDYSPRPKVTDVKNVLDYLEDLIEEDIYLLPIDPMRTENGDGKLALIQRKKWIH